MKTADLVDDVVYAVTINRHVQPAALISHEKWTLSRDQLNQRVYRDRGHSFDKVGALVVTFSTFHLRDLDSEEQMAQARAELQARLPEVAENLRDQLPSDREVAQPVVPHPYLLTLARPAAILAPWEEHQRVEAEQRERQQREQRERQERQRVRDAAERAARDRLRSVVPLLFLPTSYVELEQFGKDYAAWLAGESPS
jgi:hypothetical protein